MESCPSWSKEHDWKSCKPQTRLRGFESLALRQKSTVILIELRWTFYVPYVILSLKNRGFRSKNSKGDNMYFHASQIGKIKTLEPRISNHNIPLIYFSDKRENVLVYLSNAVEKVCKEGRFTFDGLWYKWGSYGFEKDGRLRFEEYYPNALEDTYKGIEGYIYSCSKIDPYQKLDIKIPNTFITAQKTTVDNCEFIPDAYNEMINAEENGLITILRYNEFISNIKRREWLKKTIIDEYRNNSAHPDYRFFLESRFSAIINHDSDF